MTDRSRVRGKVRECRPSVALLVDGYGQQPTARDLCRTLSAGHPSLGLVVLAPGLTVRGANPYLLEGAHLCFDSVELREGGELAPAISTLAQKVGRRHGQRLRRGELMLDRESLSASLYGRRVHLPRSLFDALWRLAEELGRPVPYARIVGMEAAPDSAGCRTRSRNLAHKYISRLRRHLGPNGDMVVNLYGRGYALDPGQAEQSQA